MGWIGVDFDGTLAKYDKWEGADKLGEPIKLMLDRVKNMLCDGHEIRIFTARVWPITTVITPNMNLNMDLDQGKLINDAVNAAAAIRFWCIKHLGKSLSITCVKDFDMLELYDDRAIQVVKNTGILIGQSTRDF